MTNHNAVRAVQVRLATPTDAAALPVIERSAAETFRTLPDLAWVADEAPISEAEHLAWISGARVWVAVDAQDRPVGFLDAEVFGADLHLWEMSVQGQWQGRGIGRRLFDAAAAYARGANLKRLTLTTFCDVPWNAPFYARVGFEVIDGANVGARLGAILAEEVAAGYPAARRCAMQRPLPVL